MPCTRLVSYGLTEDHSLGSQSTGFPSLDLRRILKTAPIDEPNMYVSLACVLYTPNV